MPKMTNPAPTIMPAPKGTDSPGGLTRTLGADSTAGNRGYLSAEQEGGAFRFTPPDRKHDEPIDDLLSGRKRHKAAPGDGGG